MLDDTPQTLCTYTLLEGRAGSAIPGMSVPDAKPGTARNSVTPPKDGMKKSPLPRHYPPIGYLVLSYIEKRSIKGVSLCEINGLGNAVERQKGL